MDSYDSGGTENTLTGFDPTQGHEFWIQIVKDTSGGGTHKVTIWMDGVMANPRTFHVTAGTKLSGIGPSLNSIDRDGGICDDRRPE